MTDEPPPQKPSPIANIIEIITGQQNERDPEEYRLEQEAKEEKKKKGDRGR